MKPRRSAGLDQIGPQSIAPRRWAKWAVFTSRAPDSINTRVAKSRGHRKPPPVTLAKV